MKIVCIGANYADHIAEMKSRRGSRPVLFLKPSTALLAPGEPIRLPAFSTEVHHEVELVAVIGRRLRGVAESRALEGVSGYAVGLDLTARDLQRQAKQRGEPWSMAKGFDGSAPLSEVAAAAAVGDASDLAIELRVNGELRQAGRTSQMIHPLPAILAYASSVFTLEP